MSYYIMSTLIAPPIGENVSFFFITKNLTLASLIIIIKKIILNYNNLKKIIIKKLWKHTELNERFLYILPCH